MYAVWCLEDSRVKFQPSRQSQRTFEAGYRRDPEDYSKRYFRDKAPGEYPGDERDVSWIAEPAKAFGGGKLNGSHNATTRVLGLRGELRATVVQGKPPLKDTVVWDWCYPTYVNGVLTRCEPDPGRLRDYDQTLSEAAAIDIKSEGQPIVVRRNGDRNRIFLKQSNERSKVYIQNIPRHADLKKAKNAGQDICVAEHFKLYESLLAGFDLEDIRLPWRPTVNGNCTTPPVHSVESKGVVVFLVTDSFCPPGGINRNP
jgi:hypothetical protein